MQNIKIKGKLLITGFCITAIFISACSDRSNPKPSPVPDTSTARYAATITRTTDSIPHIVASDEGSLAYGLGYVSAEDHICKIADGVLWGRGEFSKFHGPGESEINLNRDLTYRAVSIYDRAVTAVDNSSEGAKEWLRGYAAGYNEYLEEVSPEGVSGWCRGGAWLRPINEYDLAAFHTVLGTAPTVGPLASYVATAVVPSDEIQSQPQAALQYPDAESEPLDGSNSWAVGADRTLHGGSILMGNSHLSWEDRLHYYEVHLVIPGEFDAYGAVIAGFPGIVHGFNKDTAWSITISNGHRFTAYTLDLVEGNPTAYHYDDEVRDMTSKSVSVEVLRDDGAVETIERTMWSSHYGPILNFPGVGWGNALTLTMRDGNEGLSAGDRLFHDLASSRNIDDIIAAHRNGGGMIAFTTIAADATGRTWFGDTAATPNLSDEALTAWQNRLDTDIFTKVAYSNQIVLLHGSNSRDEWLDDPNGSRPGLMPFSELPQLERADFVFNSNDAYRWTNQAQLLDGYTPMNGPTTRVTARTRMNARQISEDRGGAGGDGLFTLEEVKESALANRVFTAELLLDQVVERCLATSDIDLGGETVSLTEACGILSAWDRKANLESQGAILWREFINRPNSGSLYADARDDLDYVNTPAQLATGDEILVRLAGAVKTLQDANLPLDIAVGDIQFAYRGELKIPVHGGVSNTGVTNRVGSRPSNQTSAPATPRGALVPGSNYLRTDGYPVSGGSSFLLTVKLTPNATPEASAIMTYGNTSDESSEQYSAQTIRFANKDWRSVAFTADAIEAETIDQYEVTSSR